VIFILTAS